jgi:hypothetical protein
VEKFTHVILPAYHNKPHEGYAARTPMARYLRLPKARTEDVDWAVLADREGRKEIGMQRSTQGVRFKNRLYWDPCLMQHVGERVTVRFNREDDDIIIAVSRAETRKPEPVYRGRWRSRSG